MQPLQRRHNKVRERRLQVSTEVSSWVNFNPLSLQPSIWMDSSDLSTITESSGAVSQWTDKSSNAFAFTQSVAAAQPTTGTRTVNGRNAIDFDAGDRLFRNSTSIVNQSDGTFTIFAVVLADISSGTRTIFSGDPGGGARPPQFLRLDGTTLQSIRITRFDGTTGVVTASLTSAFTAGNPVLVRSVLNSAVLQVFADYRSGTAVASTGGASASATLHEIGAANNGQQLFDGLICEIIAYPSVLTNPQINVVELYLRQKWATP